MNAIKYFTTIFRKKHPTYYTLAIIVLSILLLITVSGIVALIIIGIFVLKDVLYRVQFNLQRYSIIAIVMYAIYTLRNGVILKLDVVNQVPIKIY